jgi:hypothetical protein
MIFIPLHKKGKVPELNELSNELNDCGNQLNNEFYT